MIGFLFFFFGIIVTIGMCGLAAWTDFKGFKIPNIISLIIIAAFGLAYTVTHFTGQSQVTFFALSSHIIAFLLVFAVTMALFAAKIMGAGDSKLMSAVSLWLGLTGLVPFLFYMSFIGGALAGSSLLLKKYKPFKNPPKETWIEKAQEGVNSVPYGIAIAAGTFISFCILGYFSPSKWTEMFNF